MFIKYILLSIIAICGTILAYPASVVFSSFLDDDGNLKYLRWWLQPPDMHELWGHDWAYTIKDMPREQAVRMYLLRNPSQGLDTLLGAHNISMSSDCLAIPSKWLKNGRWLYVGKYWEFSASIPFMGGYLLISHGWRLKNIYEGYPHKTMGQLIGWPLRWNRKGT